MSPRELSDPYLKSLKPPESGRVEISDTKRRGLRLRITAAGKATWMYEKRVKGGAKRKHTFGTYCTWNANGKREYGPIGLTEARALALEIEAEASKGIDRISDAAARKKEEEAAQAKKLSVQDAINLYDQLHLSGLRSGAERKRQLEQALSAHLNLSLSELTRKDLQAAIDAKAAAGRKPYANRIRTALMAFANWAWKRGYIGEPIAAGLAKATSEAARERVLSVKEIKKIWHATFKLGDLWGPPFRLIILTGQRRSEIFGLRWDEVDLDKARIVKPGSRTKNGKPHVTHLANAALRELRKLSGSRDDPSGLVFTTTGSTAVSGISKVKLRLDQILGDDFEHWRIHDIRTAMATALAEAGEPETVVDRILNHAASGSAPSAVARVYIQADMLQQRAAALDRWAEMVTGEEVKIVHLSSR